MDHNDESARPYVVWALELTAAALVLLLASCLRVDGSSGCDDLGMSAVAATSSLKPPEPEPTRCLGLVSLGDDRRTRGGAR
jgi:hypothetical protein